MANNVDPVGMYAYGEVLTEYVSVSNTSAVPTGVTCVVMGQEAYGGVDYLYVDNIKGGTLGIDSTINSYSLRAELTTAIGTSSLANVKYVPTYSNLAPTTLKTTYNGKLFGTFNIPNNSTNSFRTGIRQLRFTDSVTNDTTLERTAASANYTASGVIENLQKTVLSTRTATIALNSITQDISTTTLNTMGLNVTWYDPLAQTFLVDTAGGVFATDVDLYFSSKDDVLPVRIELREVVNGYPGSKVIPFSNVVVDSSNVVVDELRGATATNFKFKSPVYLQDKAEYALCVFSDSSKYKAWVSQVGEFDVNSAGLIAVQPYAGVLFKSQNASTWTADQTQDLKFQINRAVFSTSTSANLTLVNQTTTVDVGYDLVQINVSSITPAGTAVTATLSGSSIQLGDNLEMLTRTTITAGASSLSPIVTLSTTSSNLSPVIDLSRCAATLVANVIENVGSDNETAATGGTAGAKYVTKQVNLNTSASNLRVMFNCNVPNEATINVYYKVAGAGAAVDFDSKGYTLAAATTKYTQTTNSALYSPAEYMITGLSSFDVVKVKIVMKSSNTAKVPKIQALRVIAYA